MKPISPDPRQADVIFLGKNKNIDRLYGCFRIDNPRGRKFETEGTLEITGGGAKRLVRVVVPPRMRVDIPAGMQASESDLFSVELLGDSEDTMFLLSMRVGWNQTEEDITRIAGQDPRGCFLAKLRAPGSDIPAGTSAAIPLGPTRAWIGMVLVHPELRHQGIATELLHSCLKHIHDSGRRIIGLDATPEGRAVYEALGFTAAYRIWRTSFPLAQFDDTVSAAGKVLEGGQAALEDILDYDSRQGFDRSLMIEALVRGSRCFVSRGGAGGLNGYCLTRPGRLQPFVGPLVSDTREIARGLLAATSRALREGGAQEAFIDSPEEAFVDAPGEGPHVAPRGKPSRHKLMSESTCVRLFLRMYQLVEPGTARALAEDIARREGLEPAHPRVRERESVLGEAASNFSLTSAFIEAERKTAGSVAWGTSGPEKG